jgi:hypothetical protein
MDLTAILGKLHCFAESATILLDQRYILPALALLYTGIDIAASLERLGHESTKKSFIRWCDCYLLKQRTLSCTSADLYSARCGILHAHSAESDLTRAGKAKKVFYAWGTGTTASLDAIAKFSNRSDAVNIHVSDLREAFAMALKNGLLRWGMTRPERIRS